MIVGFTKGKAHQDFFNQFTNLIDFICPVRVEGEPNPENPEIIQQVIQKSEITTSSEKQNNISNAIKFLSNINPKLPFRILICGSIYLARDIKN